MTAYTHNEQTIVRRIMVVCKVGILDKDIDQEKGVKALWDTGAMCTCISLKLADSLGLQPDDYGWVNGANNQPFQAPIYSVQLKMGHFSIPYLRVYGLPMDGQENDVIIGMDVMVKGDLSVTNYEGKTVLTFREPSIATIDYVADLKKYNEMRARYIKSKIEKCPCGSGKLWKNCHGKSSLT